MAYLMPKPPGMSKEQSDKWDKDRDNYYRFMSIGMIVVAVFFMVLVGIIIYAKILK